MTNHENFESTKTADSMRDGGSSNLSTYALERLAPNQNERNQQKGLIENGVLPSLSFNMADSYVRTGTEAKPQELKDSGVRVQHGKDGSVKSEYPSGVVVESIPPVHSTKDHVTLGPTIGLSPEKPNHMNSKGDVVDPKGRVIAHMNDDGSVTVDSGKGFYTHHPDGTIDRESAIRSRDGKTFKVLDTNNPLGGMSPSDLPHPRK
jgi:hypothetical protein